MSPPSLEILRRRVRSMRQRVLVRSWEYRQRHLAKGVWFRLRRVLASAEAAYVIPEHVAAELLEEGLRPEAVGAELEPPKTLVFVPRDRLERISERREIPVSLGSEMLAARAVALRPFREPVR